jgi:hypothetical protein
MAIVSLTLANHQDLILIAAVIERERRTVNCGLIIELLWKELICKLSFSGITSRSSRIGITFHPIYHPSPAITRPAR